MPPDDAHPSRRARRLRLALAAVGCACAMAVATAAGPVPVAARPTIVDAVVQGFDASVPTQVQGGGRGGTGVDPGVSELSLPELMREATLNQPIPLPIPPAPDTLEGYRWPIAHPRLTLPFGPSPWGSRLVEGRAFHDGIDLATFCGDRITAAHAGMVLAAGRHYDDMMGWVGDLEPYRRRLDRNGLWPTLPIVVVIDDGNGYRSMYAHFNRVVVERGQKVRAGQLLGFEGDTGRASGCHLHYGLFSPWEIATFRIVPDVARRMKLPREQIARVDPLDVLPPRGRLR